MDSGVLVDLEVGVLGLKLVRVDKAGLVSKVLGALFEAGGELDLGLAFQDSLISAFNAIPVFGLSGV